ncbi:MAG: hypothetical protein J3Q66DRAFT_193143 [Benniella sp.]|nr:MAG: hypothetical protein J3Q66DRAFT_193143 [Benniella sp.]
MAATATISASTTLSVVGRTTMTLDGTSSPPTTPPATPTSPLMSNSTLTASDSAKEATADSTPVEQVPVKVKAEAEMVATPPPSPPPAPVSSALPPVTPFPSTSVSDDSLSAPMADDEDMDNSSAGHPLSTQTLSSVALTEPVHSQAELSEVSEVSEVSSSISMASSLAEATTFFDDMINAPQPPANILTLSPTKALPDLYHEFFDNHPELYDSDQASDLEMDLDPDDYSPAVIRARTMADMRQTAVTAIQVPLIADRPKLETIDTINLMLHHQNGSGSNGQQPMTTHIHSGVHGLQHNHGLDDGSAAQGSQRRKKATRACFHCQKAHLTCDDSRPCQRCVKRDLSGSCTDGVRKKAKYLQDTLDSQQQAAEQETDSGNVEESPLNDAHALFSFPNVPSSTSSSPSSFSSLTSAAVAAAAAATFTSLSPGSNTTSSTAPTALSHGFGSDAINLEYSILSTMLSSPTSELQSMTADLSMVENWQRQGAIEAMANSLQHQHQQQAHLQRSTLTQQPQQSNIHNHGPLQPMGVTRATKRKFPSNTPENVYANTKQAFNYTDGFHYLLRYVRERMDKEEMMRVCRAMAMFRPSFIALIKNLTPEDLVFMEISFQRTILEYEKLISFSGTPTVVWRRTGEIALVGKEFSLLTQWPRDQLVNKKTYIYELMENQSAVEYWEKFSTHAFENTEQTVMTTCILLSPTNRMVPCTFCFTIKRDIFDIPLAIVGNFLPILS